MERETRPGVYEGFIHHLLPERKTTMPSWRTRTMEKNDFRVHVKYDTFRFDEKNLAQTYTSVSAANVMLAHVLSLLPAHGSLRDGVKEEAKKYFKTDAAGPSKDEFNTIKSLLELIQAGINSEATVKFFESADTSG